MVTLEIDGVNESFGRVWVHLADTNAHQSVPYKTRIAISHLSLVFDACDKEKDETWYEYLRNEANELGSVMFSSYFQTMRQIAGADEQQYRWVIATLDDVIESADWIELRGRAVPFDANRFAR
jgi:hypothetical protein